MTSAEGLEDAWPRGNGEMAARIRGHDWSSTQLGALGDWPQPLKTAVDIMLGSAMPIGIYWGPDLVLLYNDAWCDLILDKHPAALGRPARESFAEIWTELEPRFAGVLAGHGASRADDQFLPLHRRGRIDEAWFSYSFDPIPLKDGSVGGVLTIAAETTRHMLAGRTGDKAQAALRESEARFRLMADVAPPIIWITDAEGRLEFFNRQWEAYMGAPPAGATVEEVARGFLHPDDADETLAQFEAAGQAGRAFEVEHRFRSKTGAYRWFLARAEPYSDPKTGQVVRWFGASTDIHDRKVAEQELRKSEARLRKVLDIETVGVVFFDLVGGIHDANDAFLATIGYTRAELEAGEVRYENLTPPEWQWRDEQTAAELKAHGKAGPFEKEYFRKDGSRLWILCADKMLDEESAVEFVIDVTERKLVEQHQDMLMAELDHRVKNILAVVQAISRQSLGRGAGPDAAERLIGRINALAQSHMLLASSRWEGADVRALVESAVAPYRGDRAERVVTGGPDLKVTPKAAQTLSLALHELVTNAAKHGALSGDDGRVTAEWSVTGAGKDGRLVFVWQEHGGPRIEAPPTRKGFGSRLIEQTLTYELDGDVTLDFASGGLRAVLDLPLQKLRAKSLRDSRVTPRSEDLLVADYNLLGGKRALVVEDEYLVAQETAEALRAAGCTVVGPVSDIAQAVLSAETEQLDAAVLDINLRGKLAWPVADALRARGIPFIFASGYAETLQPPPELAHIPRIEKPIRPQRLVAVLSAVVETKRQR